MKNHNIQLIKSLRIQCNTAALSIIKSVAILLAFSNFAFANIAPTASFVSGGSYSGTTPFVTEFSVGWFTSTFENVDFIEFTAPAGVTIVHDLPSPSPYGGTFSLQGDELPANNGGNGVGWGNPFFPTGGSAGNPNGAPFLFVLSYNFGVSIDPGLMGGDIQIDITLYGDGNGEAAPSVETISLIIIENCAPEIIGDASVCPDQLSTYTVNGGAGSSFSWTVDSNGGSIVGPSTGTSIDVQWNSTPGGAYELRVNEIDGANSCTGNSSLFVIIEGNVNMACNDTVNFSLDTLCQGEITPDILLEGPQFEAASYEVVTYDEGGNLIPGNIVNGNHVGELLTVRVSHLCTGVSCWGNVFVEDKIVPPLMCASDTIACSESTDPFDIGFPVPPAVTVLPGPGNSYLAYNFDACGGPVTLTYFDEVENTLCGNMFSQIIYRNWTAVDESGNESNCQDTIYSLTATIDDIVCPPDYDDMDEPSLRCGQNFIALPNGHPSPEETGYPLGVDCNNINFFFQDLRFDICGNSYKLLRHWVILDWCTGRDTVCDQIIKVIDDDQPIITCPLDGLTGTTDPWVCTGTIEMPLPNIIFECSDWTYKVGYLLADNNGNPPVNGQYEEEENITYNPLTNRYTITGLPIGRTWIRYTVRDDCGYITECFTEIDIFDVEPPTAVCETSTVVSLSSDGLAAVYATSIDDNSIDNCEVDRVEIRREDNHCGTPSDLVFGEKVKVCCEDVAAGSVKVRLRVYDHTGLFNDCVVDVVVQDEQDPVINCPPNLNLDCTLDRNDLSLTGQATATDNCFAEIDYNDVEFLDECGIGYVDRYWTATDQQGRTDLCIQRITITNSDPLDETDIIWPPATTEVEGCTAADAHPDITGRPQVFANCIKLAISYEDQEYINVEDVCKKIRRTWTVVDWCNYDPEVPQIKFVQKIILSGSENPVIVSDCSPKEESSLNNVDCEAYIDLTVAATDDCTPSSELFYSYQVDLDSDGIIDFNNVGNDASGFYPNGSHQVTYFVEDACGNFSSCTQDFRIVDTKAPTPLCFSGISLVLLEENESITIWAVDFDQKSFDNCTPEEDLEFSFSTNVNDKGRTFTCADLPDGVKAEIPLQVYVTDEDGNQDFCSVQATVVDNKNLCPDDPDVSAMIAGRVISSKSSGIDEIEIRLADSEGNQDMNMTEEDGDYAFDQLALYRDYQITPYKNDDVINGVSTLDLVLIQKHILGLNQLEGPYNLIAADINKSGSITATDLVQLRKLILGIFDEFPNNTSWRFIEEGHEFEDNNEPWEFPEKTVVNDLILNEENGNFTGVKIGDVNGSAVSSLLMEIQTESRSDDNFETLINNKKLQHGEIIEAGLYSINNHQVQGMQMTIEFDAFALTYLGYAGHKVDLGSHNISVNAISEGMITISWDKVDGVEIEEMEVLFTLKFKSNVEGELKDYLDINSAITKAEAYDVHNLIMPVINRFEDTDQVSEINGFRLLSNYPDPFAHSTTIAFELPDASDVEINIYDVSGRLITNTSGFYNAGINNVTISSSDIKQSGVLYYQVKTDFGSQTRKMVKLD